MNFFAILVIFPLSCLSCPSIISRQEWNARPPSSGYPQCMAKSAKNVLIHHTYIPKFCSDVQVCKDDMKSIQRYHQESRKWNDIGYNFCMGGNGEIYEGRGWGFVGYPAKGYEFNSTGICFIGDYTDQLPTDKMIFAAVKLINCGIQLGYIDQPFNLLGIQEVISTQSPGKALQNYITKTRFGFADVI